MSGFVGEIRAFPFPHPPVGWLPCDGALLKRSKFPSLFDAIGLAFGSASSEEFRLPDIRGRFPIGAGGDGGKVGTVRGSEKVRLDASSLPWHNHLVQSAATASSGSPTGMLPGPGGTEKIYSTAEPDVLMADGVVSTAGAAAIEHDHVPPGLAMTFAICTEGPDPRRNEKGPTSMLAEIRMFAYEVDTPTWQPCDGRALEIAENQALYSVVGSAYGPSDNTWFWLPDLRGRIPYMPQRPDQVGRTGGEARHTVGNEELPAHSHELFALDQQPTSANARTRGAVLSRSRKGTVGTNVQIYGSDAKDTMHAHTITHNGSRQIADHDNLPPVLSVAFHMAVRAMFPMRDDGSP